MPDDSRVPLAEAALKSRLQQQRPNNGRQKADLDRLRAEQDRARPNRPERAPESEMELAFERVIATFGEPPAANDASATGSEGAPAPASKDPEKRPPSKRRHRHGRRRLDLTALPVVAIPVDPDEVRAAGGVGFVRVGDETAERIAFKPAQYVRLRIVRRKYVPADRPRVDEPADKPPVLVAPPPPRRATVQTWFALLGPSGGAIVHRSVTSASTIAGGTQSFHGTAITGSSCRGAPTTSAWLDAIRMAVGQPSKCAARSARYRSIFR